MNKVAAVVVTYNRIRLLKECLDALQKQIYSCDILVVDNASTDGTEEYVNIIKKKYSNIFYKNTGANIGGAGGFNFGMRWAVESGYDYVWVMDDDCIPEHDALKAFFNADIHLGGNYGFLSSKVLWRDKSISHMNVQRETMYKNLKTFDDMIKSVVMASFVSLFIPVKIIKEVGLPIKDFFIWTDDWEYTRRISKRYKCYYVSESVVVHKSNFNKGANVANDSVERLNRYYYLYRNDVYLYKREGILGIGYEICRLNWHIIRILLFSKDNYIKRLKCIFNGTLKGLTFNPEIEFIK